MICGALSLGVMARPEDRGEDVSLRLPDMSLPLLGKLSDSIRVARLGEPGIVAFWASWCTYCDHIHAVLDSAKSRYGDRIASIGVVSRDTPAAALLRLQESGITDERNLIDRRGDMIRRLGFRGVPAALVVDSNARIQYGCVGCQDEIENLLSVLERLVNDAGQR